MFYVNGSESVRYALCTFLYCYIILIER